MIQLLAPSLIPVLTQLFQKSLNEGIFPDYWKLTNIFPIYKNKGDKQCKDNYRPIALTSCLSKLFEQIVNKRLLQHCISNNILSPNQSGFRKCDSTINQLLYIMHECYLKLELSNDLRYIFLDISKAFDRVWHDRLLLKLKSYGIEGNVLKWIQSYLYKRQIRVVIDGECSSWIEINAGVPHGAVLAPLLFIIYINDLSEQTSNPLKLFADDSSLVAVFDSNKAACEQRLQHDIQKVIDWSNVNYVAFNPNKIKEMIMSKKRPKLFDPDLFFKGVKVSRVESNRHLGIVLNSEGSWHDDINDKCSKALKKMNLMRPFINIFDRCTLSQIYCLYIRPILEYGAILFGNSHSGLSKILENVQYEAALITTGTPRGTSQMKLIDDLGWNTLEERRCQARMCHLYKLLHGLTVNHGSYPNWLITDTRRYATRSSVSNVSNVRPILGRTIYFNHSFFPHAITEWNALDTDLRTSQSLGNFKSQLKSKLFRPLYAYHSTGNRKYQTHSPAQNGQLSYLLLLV